MANFRNIENINLFPSKTQPANSLSRGSGDIARRESKKYKRKPSKRCRRHRSFETDRLLLLPFHRLFCNFAGWPAFVPFRPASIHVRTYFLPLPLYCCCSERSSPSFRCYSQFFTFLNINWTLFLKFVESTLSRSGRRVFGP